MSKSVESTRGSRAQAGHASSRVPRLVRGAVLAALFAAGMAIAVPNAQAGPAPVPDGAQLFGANCVVCHGQDGKGTDTGKSLMTPDLHSDAVQKQTDAMLAQIISNGKNNMPPFMSTLSKADIQNLVVYIRTFGKKAK